MDYIHNMEIVKGLAEIRYNFPMNFHEWFNRKYLEWRGDSIGQEGSKASFARWLDISPQSLDEYLDKDGQIPSYKKTIDKLAHRFGPEVYEVLGIEPQEISTINYLPPEFRRHLKAALSEVRSELELRGLSKSDPEAEEIVIKIFSNHGLKWTRTTRS